jgi:hypothetical protein
MRDKSTAYKKLHEPQRPHRMLRMWGCPRSLLLLTFPIEHESRRGDIVKRFCRFLADGQAKDVLCRERAGGGCKDGADDADGLAGRCEPAAYVHRKTI